MLKCKEALGGNQTHHFLASCPEFRPETKYYTSFFFLFFLRMEPAALAQFEEKQQDDKTRLSSCGL